MKVTFILQLFCIKDPMAYVYLQIGLYTYLRAYFPYDSINLTPNIIFLLISRLPSNPPIIHLKAYIV
jgi:hypothetical protein